MENEMIGNKMLKVNDVPNYLAEERESMLHSHSLSYPSQFFIKAEIKRANRFL
jgi:hypothetical protein